MLQATKAGMAVAKLRGNSNKEIGALATEIVTKWKKTVQNQQKKMKSAASPNAAAASSPAATPAASHPETKGFVGDKSKRKWATDQVDTKRTGIPTRDSCIGLMYDGLAFMSGEPATVIIIKAMEVEAAAYEVYKGETPDYKATMRRLFQNLKLNRDLSTQVLSGDITCKKLVVMSHDELKSAERRKEDAALDVENMKKAQVPMEQKSISDALRCGRCRMKKVSYSQAQTRSADEPMTTFCECMNCGNRWKVSTLRYISLHTT